MTSQEASKDLIPKKVPLPKRLKSFVAAHNAVFGVLTAVLVFACLALLFWFTIFSGLSGSADFIYAQF